MALIKCKECNKEVSSDAATCPGCGKTIKAKKKSMGCGTFILIIIVGLVVIGYFSSSDKGSSSAPRKVKTSVNFNEIEKGVGALIKAGLVKKVNPSLNEAYVSRSLWNSTTIDQKKTAGYLLGYYCGHKKGSNLYWVEIKDINSGKKLAKWSASWGYKVLE